MSPVSTRTQLSLKAAAPVADSNQERTAFQCARIGDSTRLARLLAAGLPVDLCNERGDSLLRLASFHGHLGATLLLLEHKADPERVNDRGQTVLAGVAFRGDVAAAQLLLDYGARVDGTGTDGKTALMIAAMFDQLEVLKLLLARGATPGLQDARECTALDYALATGARGAASWLEQLSWEVRAPRRPDSGALAAGGPDQTRIKL
jgi:ankyrin repeat protein